LEQINYNADGIDSGDAEIVAAVPVWRDEVGIKTFLEK
jgi:hypothetical protein